MNCTKTHTEENLLKTEKKKQTPAIFLNKQF